jgi:erythrocyte band 7 integral membrane protein
MILTLFKMVVTDLRTVSFDVPKQEILTKDSVTVNVDAVVYYSIYHPLNATCKVEFGKE